MGVSADFVLNYGHKSRFNLLRSVVFELFVMLMGGGLVGWALLWSHLWTIIILCFPDLSQTWYWDYCCCPRKGTMICWLFTVLAAGCGVWWLWSWSVISGLVLTGQYPCQAAGGGPVCTGDWQFWHWCTIFLTRTRTLSHHLLLDTMLNRI